MMSEPLSHDALHEWFFAPHSLLNDLFKMASRLTEQHFHHQITLFNPGSHFPSISITGKNCHLNCQHCEGHFLQHMQAITQPHDLLLFCQNLAQKGGIGCLISGGCDSNGRLPLTPFLPILTEIKQKTRLFLNVHTGFLSDSEAQQLSKTGIDCASVDIVGANETLHSVYGLKRRSLDDYITTLNVLKKNHLTVSPHICVGLHYGKLLGELTALEYIHSILQPNVLVIIAFMPTPNTPMANAPPANPLDVAKVCALARLLFPKTEIALGCMRPRGAERRRMEQLAIQAGVTRIVLPTKATRDYLLEEGYAISTKNACCVI